MKADLTNINHYPVEKLLITLRKYDELVFPEADYFIELYPEYKNNCIKLLKESGVDVTEVQNTNLFEYCEIQLGKLVKDGLIKHWEKQEAVNRVIEASDNSPLILSHKVYTLTAKGLDFALKIEAHNDTNTHNKLTRQIGLASFLIAFLSLMVSGYLTNKNITISEERLKISQARIETLEKQLLTNFSKEELMESVLEIVEEQKQTAQNESTKETPPFQNLKVEEQTKTPN